MIKKLVSFLFIMSTLVVFGQQNTPFINFKVTAFASDSTHFIIDKTNKNIEVIFFLSGSCAYYNYYKTRVQHYLDTYKSKIKFSIVAPISDNYSLTNDFNNTRIYKASTAAIKQNDLHKTPSCMVVYDHQISYIGAIDDNPQNPQGVRNDYLGERINELLNKRNLKFYQRHPVGCFLR